MPSPRRVMRLSFALMLCWAAPIVTPDRAAAEHGSAVVPEGLVRFEHGRPAALDRSPAWLAFRRRHGDWQAMWNQRTQTPHRAFGSGIALGGFANDERSLDRAVRGFVSQHPELFAGAPDLATLKATRAGRLWYLRYQQTLDGLPVLFADWEFRVSEDGRLVGFGADAVRDGDYRRPAATIVGAVAREAAKQGLAFDPSSDRVTGGERRFLLPVPSGDGVSVRQVYEVTVQTTKPRGQWLTFVDAENGSVLYRRNLVRTAVDGVVTGLVHPTLPTDTKITVPFQGEWVNVSTEQATTNGSGWYTAPAAGSVTVTSSLSGPYCQILRQDGGTNANFSKNVSDPTTQNIAWLTNNSLDAERDAFYHVNLAHDYVKGLDPAYTANDVVIPVNIQWLDDECSTYWDGVFGTLNFVDQGAVCPNTATVPDMIYHEYAHSVNDKLYYAEGASFGMQNETLHEALADANSAFMTDDPVIGSGFFGPGTSLRTIDTAARWPEDATPSAHQTGLILGGALWDLREAVGLTVAGNLTHFAKYGLADDAFDDGVALSEFFVEVLHADDDDADLSNGTPNFTAIVDAFNAHGIGTSAFLGITHSALGDQATNGPYPISALVQYTGPVGTLADVKLHYSVNNLAYVAASMTPTGNPDEWGAEVPAQSGAIVHYYIEALDSYGGAQVTPAGAPVRDVFVFIAGPAFPLIPSDLESDPGWIVGQSGDDADTGIWLRADPVGTQAQPEDDHTETGTQCFVTGNADPLDFPGMNDVDGGKTTLRTAIFDPTGWQDPIVSYWRWFSNNTGDAPDEDYWRVDISNNGGSTWVPVEATTVSELSWRRVVFFISDILPVTNNMRMRFTAEDVLNPSLVEAAVDDWDLLAFPPGVSVGPQAPARGLSLAAPSPNPSRGTTAMRMHLPVAGRVTMAVYDLHGRSIRTLVDGDLTAGDHTMSWDGRDDRGRAVASGPYFVRAAQAGRVASQAVVMIK